MSNNQLVIIILICGIFGVGVTLATEISDWLKIKFIKNVPFRIAVSAILSVVLFLSSQKKDDNSAKDFRNELSKRDSINQFKIDNNTQKFQIALNDTIKWYTANIDTNTRRDYKDFIGILANYNLKYDSSQKKIVNLVRDSTNNENPEFEVFNSKNYVYMRYNKKGDSIIGQIAFYNNGNCPLRVNLDYYYLESGNVKGEAQLSLPVKVHVFSNYLLGKEHCSFEYINRQAKITNAIELFFLLKGDYSTLDKRKKYLVNDLYVWDFKENGWGLVDDSVTENYIRSIIEKYK